MLIKKRWLNEEIDYLMLSYPNPNISLSDISIHLNRSMKSIMHKAERLHIIWKYKNKTISVHKRDPKYDTEWYHKNKPILLSKRREYRSNKTKKWELFKSSLKCEVCGINHPAVLEFHHIDPSKKEYNISRMHLNTNKDRLIEEIKKCKVLCSNHHRILHWRERNASVG